jgi:hypothetical protein
VVEREDVCGARETHGGVMLVVVDCVTHTMRPDGPAADMRAECRHTSNDLDSEAGCIATLTRKGGPRVVFIDGALSYGHGLK